MNIKGKIGYPAKERQKERLYERRKTELINVNIGNMDFQSIKEFIRQLKILN